jgi:hypothetical protein
LEQLVDGMSAAIFRGGMHPVEVAGRLVRQADLLVQDTWMGPAVPNVYSVRINPKDVAEGVNMGALERELATALAATAAERGWRLGGPVVVQVTVDPSVAAGSIGCDASVATGPMQPWGHLIGTAKSGVHELGDNRILIGRRTEADITLPIGEVSRSHAILYRHLGQIWLQDLESANGTWINGARAGSEPLPVSPGDQITIGPATFSLRLV